MGGGSNWQRFMLTLHLKKTLAVVVGVGLSHVVLGYFSTVFRTGRFPKSFFSW